MASLSKKGKDQGTLVLETQKALNQFFGTNKIVEDGFLGSGTDLAIKQFQLAKGLISDGAVGLNTQKLLGLDFTGLSKNAGGTFSTVAWLLPRTGTGFRIYNPEGSNPLGSNDQFGTQKTIERIIIIAEAWHVKHPEIDIQYGDISYWMGGYTKYHKSHREGIDVDMRLFSKSGQYVPLEYTDSDYSPDLMQEFLTLLKTGFKFRQQDVFFNDLKMVEKGLCKAISGHHDHVHLRIVQ